MLIAVTQIIVLLANSGFINRSPETVTLTEIKQVEADLKEVIKSLNEINKHPNLKEDYVEVKKVVKKSKPAPVVVKQKKVESKPKVRKTLVMTPVTVVAPEPEEVINQERITEAFKAQYIKHDSKGNFLEEDNKKWTCVHDTKNSLMWEVKAKDDAMRNANNLYSWYNPNISDYLGSTIKGIPNGGRCKGEAGCDTHAYVKAMNEQNYCGHSDWHLPTKDQMQTLVYLDNGDESVKINKQYFPETMPSWYWTSTENSNKDELAWYILFRNGLALNDLKERSKHIRLVRMTKINVSNKE